MKKILTPNIAGALFAAALLFAFTQTKAQSQLLIRHFSAMYKGKTSVAVDALPDHNFLFRWSESSRLYRAYYDRSGAWSGTTVSYEEAAMPDDVRTRVRNQYGGYSISFVTEIRLPGCEPVYRVQLENATTLLIVQVNADEITEEQKLRNRPW